ncbi:ABC transporter substrate-binding protein [Herbinix luporum]|uniref:ABC transporter substrate-binding protein n=1 Tax=Herbinix luporum TaxID=1679721 RepID=UPI0023F14A4D|nr:ABC transporter substrate-binding protein [Herbinix luporum]
MKTTSKRIILVWLFTILATVALTACSNKNGDKGGNNSSDKELTDESKNNNSNNDIVNIGVTDTLSSVNPLLQDGTEVVKYTTSLAFLPLVELNKDLEFVGQLAKEITTEDNKTFTIHLDENAVWSDGQAITSEDVVFTFLLWASPEIGSTGMSIEKIEGTGDNGYVEPGADSISGVVALDEHTVQITTKSEMALHSFQNIYGRYILILPKHVLGDVPRGDLLSYDWFNAPTVVSGPYFIKDVDLNHYVTMEANENYFKGAPKIKKLNFKVVTASQLLAGLRSGEIDLVQQTTGAILQEDYDSVRALDNITVYDGTPVTNQSIFINTERITDARIRQAILYGIDRQTILNDLLKGQGEIVEGFLASAGPFYDEGVTPVEYNPDKAAQLLSEAEADGWDKSTKYTFYVNSGDTTFVQIANFIVAKLAELGLNIQVNTVDIASLLSTAGSGDFDLLAVQYTYAPVDPYTDISWLLSKEGWTRYYREEIAGALAVTQKTNDLDEIIKQYRIVTDYVQQEVPMISAYIISAIGAASNRLKNAVPDVYGTFINVHEWELVNN